MVHLLKLFNLHCTILAVNTVPLKQRNFALHIAQLSKMKEGKTVTTVPVLWQVVTAAPRDTIKSLWVIYNCMITVLFVCLFVCWLVGLCVWMREFSFSFSSLPKSQSGLPFGLYSWA